MLVAVLLMAELVTRPTFIVIMAAAIAVIVPRGLLTPMTLKCRLHAGRHVEVHGLRGVRAPLPDLPMTVPPPPAAQQEKKHIFPQHPRSSVF